MRREKSKNSVISAGSARERANVQILMAEIRTNPGFSYILPPEHPVYTALKKGVLMIRVRSFFIKGWVKGGYKDAKDYSADIV